jgi:hypothetical protein
MYRRFVAEHGWAAVPAGYDPKSVALTNAANQRRRGFRAVR